MAVYCSKCGKKLGILSAEYKSEDGSVMCSSCFNEHKTKQEEPKKQENAKVMKSIISKYLKKNGGTVKVFYEYVDYFENSEAAEYVKTLNTAGISRDDMWDLLLSLDTEDIEGDLEKLRKLFHKRGIDTDEDEIVSLFAEVVKEVIYREIDEEILPAYKEITKKIGEHPVTIEIIKEFLKMPLDHSTPVINIMRISKLLLKFNIKEDEESIVKILEKISEEVELEEFEEELG